MVRTRNDAAQLAAAGHVRVNGRRTVSPAHPLRSGDVVTLALDRGVRVLKVVGFRERRGPPASALALYQPLD